ncbi:DUF4296 domain-containing protein [Gracilimonas sp. Q87]|uniref:DUF4296 domain-containing protein n=1 Tax=Gracilimonas sp. Q87 TaxID=3384766 RepID=UPI0039842631
MLKSNNYFDLTTAPVAIVFFTLMMVVLGGCSGQHKPEKPKDLIPEDKYIDLLVEMQHIQSYRNAEPDSVNADSLKATVYNNYNVTDSQFLASHTYYQLQPERHLEQIDSVLNRLDNEELRIRSFIDSVQSQQQKGDSVKTPANSAQ